MKKVQFNSKVIALAVAVLLIVAFAAGSTTAWLAAKSDEVPNTFSHGDIAISLTNAGFEDLKMVPGKQLQKTATVTIAAGSEPCYVYLMVNKSDNFDSFMTYSLDASWVQVTGVPGVYYYGSDTAGTAVDALAAEQVLNPTVTINVHETVTKADFDAIGTDPLLKLTAYAIQSENMTDVVSAWTSGNSDALLTPNP